MCIYTYIHTYGHTHTSQGTTVGIDSLLSLCGTWDPIQVTRLCSRHLYWLRHLADPLLSYLLFSDRISLYRLLAWDLICRPGWPTYWNYHVPWSCHVPLASASQLLGLQACSTTSGSIDFFCFLFFFPLLWHISLSHRTCWISWTVNPAREESPAKWSLGRFTRSSIWIKPWRVGEV